MVGTNNTQTLLSFNMTALSADATWCTEYKAKDLQRLMVLWKKFNVSSRTDWDHAFDKSGTQHSGTNATW
jgi:hypothetical protein